MLGHGSRTAYKYGCRCFRCRLANSDYSREYRARCKDSGAQLQSNIRVRRRIGEYLERGGSIRALVTASRVCSSTIYNIRHGLHSKSEGRTLSRLTSALQHLIRRKCFECSRKRPVFALTLRAGGDAHLCKTCFYRVPSAERVRFK